MKYLIIIPIVAAVIIAAISIFLQPNDFIGCGDKPTAEGKCRSADAIVVVSGGDTNARTDEGIRLYRNGWAEQLVFSGAAQDKTGPSNAEAMKRRALDAGIPTHHIRIEEYSETTQQNAENTHDIFAEEGYESVILVTSGYHQRRASIEFQRQSNGMIILNHPLLNDKDWSAFWWLTPRGWWLAGGELVKIVITSIQGGLSE